MQKRNLRYEGKAKKVFETDDPDLLIIDYKDDITACDGKKKGNIKDKGIVNNRMTNCMLKIIEQSGIPTHYVQEISDRETVVKKAEAIPMEVIVRNIAAGSMTRRLGIPEGYELLPPTLEFHFKDDRRNHPWINEHYALTLGIGTYEEIETITNYAFQINQVLVEELARSNLKLVDFKIEFGRYEGEIILIDEISPDTCRLWDMHTNEKLDKDRFRYDMGNVESAYEEVYRRLVL
ncbi:phosphoribosylaminoimidazolesuccinocarboxamide synthase [Anaerostipes butyraticus]|uniref:Phosphoribosylaminoimidazole-succinocarboxamide synthase n=1 Tax=Anaerostipes butyraticus TaxID=645466 RepID=A0A916VDZ8_9FIRM|nr:phosphoribosylaminoimidazolesuccinocarboxamide synthase [Anaerostipes butyraticus]GFO86226.1 phosphoribosylaminoimidazole-succinocarboxamide synthase [Anaerostipes butyraticus]HJC81918.1 phosphoribosylaminoimidazolesuccinocarboxamide synthase [Candidatus Anaerostipes avicola]